MKRSKNGLRVRNLHTHTIDTNGPEQLEARELLTTLPADFAEFQVGSRLSSAPVTILGAPDGRLFVSTDNNKDKGEIFVIKNGNLLNRPAVTLSIQSLGEHGMIGMTLDPDFDDNGYLYLMYTTSEGGIHNRLSRFTFSGDTINPNTERILMDFDPLGSGTVHNGGGMAFGNDGKLYVGVGDNQIAEHAESLDTVLGKILRINPDGSIPRDNPFYNRTTGNNRAIYALGVRNPFTMDADPTTGRIFFNDVGPGSYEEINELKRGGDFGWPSQGAGPRAAPGFERAVHFYHHTNDQPGGCAITGGRFNQTRNPEFPDEYTNKYYFSDYCGGWIYSYDLDSGRVEEFASNLEVRPVSPFIDEDGALYYLSREERGVFKIEYQADNDLQITRHPEDTQVAAGEDAEFSVSVTGSGSVTYQWQQRRSGSSGFADISGAQEATLTINNANDRDDDLDVRVVIRSGSDRVTSRSATLSVASGSPPEPVISLPRTSDSYVAGDTIEYSGYATDPDEDGRLPASSLTWEVTFQHDDHNHPVLGPETGENGGSFVVPTLGETSANTWFRIHLTATDSTGLETYITKDIFPEKSTFNLESNVPGIDLLLDGTPVDTPNETLGVVNVQRSIGAPARETVDGKEYEFVGWSDGGERVHTIFTPAARTTYTATYREIESGDGGGNDGGGGSGDSGGNDGAGDANLLTYFSFDEGSGTTISEVAAGEVTDEGLLTNGVSWSGNGIEGSAIRFDGDDDYVAVGDSVDINDRDASQTTVSLWFRADEVDTSRKQVLYKQQGSTRGLNIYLDSGKLYVGGWSDKANWAGTFLSTDSIESKQWHHVALVLDADEQLSDDSMHGYLDGVRFGSGQAAVVESHLGNVSIGGRDQLTRYHAGGSAFSDDGGAHFDGLIDDFRIYGKALSSTDVRELANVTGDCGSVDGGEVDPCLPIPSVETEFEPTSRPGEYLITVSLENFEIDQNNIGEAPVSNTGHMHLLVDGRKVGRFFEVTQTFIVPEGEHLIEVELSTNDHQPWTLDGVPIRSGAMLTGAPANQPPQITSPSSSVIEITEGERFVVSLEAEDAEDGQNLSWSISGPDAEFFAVNTRRELQVVQGLDPDSPIDSDQDGRYEVNVIVTDSGGLSDQVTLGLTVPEREYPFNIDIKGNEVIAVGTDGSDEVELYLSDGLHVLRINDQTFTFDAHIIDTFHIGAGATAPTDHITVVGTYDEVDRASVLGNKGLLQSSSYQVHTYTFDHVTFQDKGTDGRAQVYGSLDSDTLNGFPLSSELRTPTHTYQMLGFKRVDAYGRGGDDRAKVFGTEAEDKFFTFDGYEALTGPGHYQTTKGFERVDAFGRGGNDSASLFDTAGNDHFYAFADFAVMQTANKKAVVKGFERAIGFANNGGFDRAYLWDVASDEEVRAIRQAAHVEGESRHTSAIAFENVNVRTKPGEFPPMSIDDIAFALEGYRGVQPVPPLADLVDEVFAE